MCAEAKLCPSQEAALFRELDREFRNQQGSPGGLTVLTKKVDEVAQLIEGHLQESGLSTCRIDPTVPDASLHLQGLSPTAVVIIASTTPGKTPPQISNAIYRLSNKVFVEPRHSNARLPGNLRVSRKNTITVNLEK